MTPKAARNLSAVAFVALLLPCKNLLIFVDTLFLSLGAPPPLEYLFIATIPIFGPEGAGFWPLILLMLLLAFLLSLALYRYLRRRDFPQLCADCAARKPLVWTLFLLFVFFSLVSPFFSYVTVSPPPDDTAYFDEDFEVSSCDESFDAPEDAPPAFQPDTQNSKLETQNSRGFQ